MPRTLLAAAWVLLVAASLSAHHSYGDIDRNQSVTLDGTIEAIAFVNPHVTLQLRTAAGQRYNVEWGGLTQMARSGVTSGTLAVGDRLLVTGSPHKDATLRHVTLLTEIRRPADGWRWARGERVSARR